MGDVHVANKVLEVQSPYVGLLVRWAVLPKTFSSVAGVPRSVALLSLLRV